MIKVFCDACGDEITHENKMFTMVEVLHPKIGSSLRSFNILPIDRANDPDICKYCVIGAINKLDDRPQRLVPSYEEVAVVASYSSCNEDGNLFYTVDAGKTELRVGDILFKRS